MKIQDRNLMEHTDEIVATHDYISDLAMGGCRAKNIQIKQWYFEQILDALGYNIDAIRGEEWAPGIAP